MPKIGEPGLVIHPNTKFTGMYSGIDFYMGKSRRPYCWNDSLVNRALRDGCDFRPLASEQEAPPPPRRPGRPRKEDRV